MKTINLITLLMLLLPPLFPAAKAPDNFSWGNATVYFVITDRFATATQQTT